MESHTMKKKSSNSRDKSENSREDRQQSKVLRKEFLSYLLRTKSKV